MINKNFGKLTIIEELYLNYTGHKTVLCLCDCGNHKIVRLTDLKRRMVRSCGCLHKKEETGKQYGDKKVVKEIGKNASGDVKYLLRCVYCSKETISTGTDLRRGRKKDCSCKLRYINKKYEMLIIKSVYKKKTKHIALCKCDCGNEKEIRLGSILRGKTKSCGCNKNNRYNRKEIGYRNGRIEVVGYEKTKNGNLLYIVKCDCGVEKKIRGHNLRVGGSTSCGICTRRESNEDRKYKKQKKKDRFIEQKYNQYKKSAEKRGYVFNLSKKQFTNLILHRCYYCGCEGYSLLGDGSKYNGIDRVDNTIGYIKENVVSCCKLCNLSKRALSKDEFFNWVARIIYYNIKQYIENR